MDRERAIHRAYGVEIGQPSTFVVRPDGYVAMASDDDDATLKGYLASAGA
ncbi:Hypothetical protein A7982_11412 [Minicystis rosea]|nr:Hypothetical protein A7982_11412 [Minicystis rosea]